jgi:hypothetical protein
VIFLK